MQRTPGFLQCGGCLLHITAYHALLAWSLCAGVRWYGTSLVKRHPPQPSVFVRTCRTAKNWYKYHDHTQLTFWTLIYTNQLNQPLHLSMRFLYRVPSGEESFISRMPLLFPNSLISYNYFVSSFPGTKLSRHLRSHFNTLDISTLVLHEELQARENGPHRKGKHMNIMF